MKKEIKNENKKPKKGGRMPFPPSESLIEYQGSGFWLTVSSPELKDSKKTFTELYEKLRDEKNAEKQGYHG
tara:strand:+ start:94 stop:306 length:213 start_codon:yes stop_codon:yes gene_type:complete